MIRSDFEKFAASRGVSSLSLDKYKRDCIQSGIINPYIVEERTGNPFNDPFGRDDGFTTHRANSIVLNNKYYDTKEEAEQVADAYRKEVYHSEIKKQFHVMEDIFSEIRSFILTNSFIHVYGISIENKLSKNELIQLFIKMYGLTIEYNEEMFDEDEKTYQKLMRDEPVVTVVEIES